MLIDHTVHILKFANNWCKRIASNKIYSTWLIITACNVYLYIQYYLLAGIVEHTVDHNLLIYLICSSLVLIHCWNDCILTFYSVSINSVLTLLNMFRIIPKWFLIHWFFSSKIDVDVAVVSRFLTVGDYIFDRKNEVETNISWSFG